MTKRHRLKNFVQLKFAIAGIALLAVTIIIGIGTYIFLNQTPTIGTTGEFVAGGIDVNKLTWEPPKGWESYERVSINEAANKMRSWQGTTCTSTNKNLIIELPKDTVYTQPINLEGGGNIVIIGGEIHIPWQGNSPTISARRAVKIADCVNGQNPRTVHIEGVKIGINDINSNCTTGNQQRSNANTNCSDLSEGIQIDAPKTTVQLQNIRINHVHARDQVNFSDNHPDLIQPYGGYKELRIDKLTGSTDYQGIFLKNDGSIASGETILKRVNVTADNTGRYLFWAHKQTAGKITLEDVWVEAAANRAGGFGKSVWPDRDGTSTLPAKALVQKDSANREYATWADNAPEIVGRVTAGKPLSGDFVPDNAVGRSYQSPGYNSSTVADFVASPLATPTPVNAPAAVATVNDPSGEAMPEGNLSGWKQIYKENFSRPVSGKDFMKTYSNTFVRIYSDGEKDTAGKFEGKPSVYYPSKVMTVKDGILTKNVHTENGVPMAAGLFAKVNPSDKDGARLYGKYSVRFRVVNNTNISLKGFKMAWLLWPKSQQWPRDGEIDFPEGDFSDKIFAANHRQDATSGEDQDVFFSNTKFLDGKWHTASTEWLSNRLTFILDGKVLGEVKSRIPNTPMFWVIQTESCFRGTCPDPAANGNVEIDWMVAYEPDANATAPVPAPTPAPVPTPQPNPTPAPSPTPTPQPTPTPTPVPAPNPAPTPVPPPVVNTNTYYMDAIAGNDANNGASPEQAWKSLDKATNFTFKPGNQLLFKRGQTYTSANGLRFTESGTSASPISVGAYGSGAAPILAVNDKSGKFNAGIGISGNWINIADLQITTTDSSASTEYGIQALGQNIKISRVKITKTGSGIGFGGRYIEASHSEITDLKLIVDTRSNAYGAIAYLFEGGRDVNIHHNYIYNIKAAGRFTTDGSAMEIFGAANNIEFAYNRVHNIPEFVTGGSSRHSDTISNIKIHHNIVTQYDYGIFFHNAGAASSFGANLSKLYVDHNTFYNNAMVGSGNGYLLGYTKAPASGVAYLRNNIVIQPLKNRFLLFIGNTERGGNIYDTRPLAGYNFSLRSTEKDKVDPKFVNKGANDFRLQSSSPAINAGVNAGYTKDYTGKAISDNKPDIGAYEF